MMTYEISDPSSGMLMIKVCMMVVVTYTSRPMSHVVVVYMTDMNLSCLTLLGFQSYLQCQLRAASSVIV